jgi:hypothetical protein
MISCATTVSETHEARERDPAEVSALIAEYTETEKAAFDPESVTPEIYNEIKEDITGFIHELNAIIRSRNYEAWRAHLDDDYYNYISSPEYLHKVSSTDIMQKNEIVLRTAGEYFTHVVVPSRQRDRVDDIEITGANRVKVITVDKGVRLRLYDLEKTNSGWKIIMPDLLNL